MVNATLTAPSLTRNPLPRRLSIALAIVAGMLTALAQLKDAPLVIESIEQRLVFDPIPVDAGLLKQIPLAYGVEEVRLAMPDGVQLHGWLKRPERQRPGDKYPLVIVYGGVRREISEFVQRAHAPGGRWGWLMVNYRGFGLSGGVPTERAVLEDAKRVYDWAAARPDVDAANIVVLGRSLGSYVAVAVAAARRARAAILATPFDSAVALGEKRFPHLPVRWFIGDRFDPGALAPAVSVPALFVIAEKDEITPAENGRALAQKWGGLKELVMLPGATHSGIESREEFWGSVGDFLKKISSPQLIAGAALSRGRSSDR